jgi:hypothetical protein
MEDLLGLAIVPRIVFIAAFMADLVKTSWVLPHTDSLLIKFQKQRLNSRNKEIPLSLLNSIPVIIILLFILYLTPPHIIAV